MIDSKIFAFYFYERVIYITIWHFLIYDPRDCVDSFMQRMKMRGEKSKIKWKWRYQEQWCGLNWWAGVKICESTKLKIEITSTTIKRVRCHSTQTLIFIYTYMHTYTHVYTHIHILAYIHTFIHTRAYIHTYLCYIHTHINDHLVRLGVYVTFVTQTRKLPTKSHYNAIITLHLYCNCWF